MASDATSPEDRERAKEGTFAFVDTRRNRISVASALQSGWVDVAPQEAQVKLWVPRRREEALTIYDKGPEVSQGGEGLRILLRQVASRVRRRPDAKLQELEIAIRIMEM